MQPYSLQRRCLALGLFLFFMVSDSRAQGGWVTQEFDLEVGWNAIWIDVDPVPATPEELLAGIDYERISTFLPGRAPGDRGEWVDSLENAPPYINTLGRIFGKRGYFIKVNTAGRLSITGRPLNKAVNFSGRGGNLYGAVFDPSSPPTFSQTFSDPNLVGKNLRIFALNQGSGEYDELALSDGMESGVAYIITVSQDIGDIQPFKVMAPVQGLQFDTRSYSRLVTIEVPVLPFDRTFVVDFSSSDAPPPGEPGDASSGTPTWLQYRQKICVEGANDGEICRDLEGCPGGICADGDWMDFGPGGLSLTVPAGEALVEFEVRGVRDGLDPTANKGANQTLYQGLLTLTDLASQNRVILGTALSILPVEGLYVGLARLSAVNSTEPSSDVESAPPLEVPLILSLPTSATEEPELLDETTIQVRRAGQDLDRKYISVLFHEPVSLNEDVPVGNNGNIGLLTGQVVIQSDDPLNPYRHLYNPEHREGYEVTRDIELDFANSFADPNVLPLNDDYVGENQLEGTYTETLTGLSVQPIVVKGAFTLVRLTSSTNLATGN